MTDSYSGKSCDMSVHRQHIEFLEGQLQCLRAFDDKAGGSKGSLWFVAQSLTPVKRCLAYADSATTTTGRQLLAISSQLQQLLGWIAHNINKHRLATAYFRAAIHTAHRSGDTHFAAYVLACMAHEAAYCDKPADAMEYAERARNNARTGPPALRALAASRLGLAHSAAGNESGLRKATEEAEYHITDSGFLTSRPPWLYWFHKEVLDVMDAQNTFVLAKKKEGASPRLLQAAKVRMENRLDSKILVHHGDRIFLGTWLARSYVWDGDVETAITIGNSVLRELPHLLSPRARKGLYELHDDLSRKRYKSDCAVEEFRRRILQTLQTGMAAN